MSMNDPVQLFYTAAFPQPMRTQLETILAVHPINYQPIYDPAFETLTPSQLFKARGFSFSRPYALIADRRTLSELLWDETPTLVVVSVRSTTAQYEWEAYSGPGDLSFLQPKVRLALLRSMAQERFTLDPMTEESFWEDESKHKFDNTLWQTKTFRANRDGAFLAFSAYASGRDVGELHAMFKKQAGTTGDVFLGAPGR